MPPPECPRTLADDSAEFPRYLESPYDWSSMVPLLIAPVKPVRCCFPRRRRLDRRPVPTGADGCPTIVFSGRDANRSGDSKNNITGGPRLGNSQGCLMRSPTVPEMARVTTVSSSAYTAPPMRTCRVSFRGPRPAERPTRRQSVLAARLVSSGSSANGVALSPARRIPSQPR